MRPAIPFFCAIFLGTLLVLGCTKHTDRDVVAVPDAVDRVLHPAELHRALRAAGGGKWNASTTIRMTAKGGGSETSVSTTTSLVMDARGNMQFSETNDKGGGRDVSRVDRNMVVGLRPGKSIRRQAQDPEPDRLVEEALGGPAAAWEIARTFTRADRTETQGAVKIHFVKTSPTAITTPTTALRKWRGTVIGTAVAGSLSIDPKTHLPQSIHLDVQFSLTGDGQPMQGQIMVDAQLTEVGAIAPVVLPDAGDLQVQQRTILEERALLYDLPGGQGLRK